MVQQRVFLYKVTEAAFAVEARMSILVLVAAEPREILDPCKVATPE
jgi:hypothetical protein